MLAMDSDGNDVVTGLRATEPDGAVDQQPTLQLSDEPMPALHKAVRGGDLVLVRKLVEEDGVHVDCVDQYHRTALHIAAQQNLLALVKALLDMGANVNAQDSHLRLPIHDSEAGSEVQELLLQHGADLRARDCFGRQAESRTPESSRGTPHLSHNCSASSLFRRRHLLRSNSMTAAEVHRVLRTFGSARRHSCPHVAMVALELELELEAETVEEVEVEDGVPAGGV